MENIFLDTNVVMDFLLGRNDRASVQKVFQYVAEGKCKAFISVGSFYTITYLVEYALKKNHIDKNERIDRLRVILHNLLSTVYIAFHTSSSLLNGVDDLRFRDLEDSYQHQAAVAAGCSCIITSNIKDFSDVDDVNVVLPKDFSVAM